jgi:hypothetical protein
MYTICKHYKCKHKLSYIQKSKMHSIMHSFHENDFYFIVMKFTWWTISLLYIIFKMPFCLPTWYTQVCMNKFWWYPFDIRIFTTVHKNKNWVISVNTEIYFEQELYSWRKLKCYNTNICIIWFPAFGGNDGYVLKRISRMYEYENISFWYPVSFWKCCFGKQCVKTVSSGMW